MTITSTTANTAIIASTGYSLTGSSASAAYSFTGTWNTSGTPNLIDFDITDTASNAASNLLSFKVSTVSKFKVDKAGTVTATTFVGALTGTASGNLVSGGALGTPSSGTLTNCTFPTLNQSTTGSAATLTTPRTINGTSFNGSANITVTAAGSTLTGTSLASGIVTSSLTTLGTLAGHLLFTDNTYDIGASGATRPRSAYFSNTVNATTFVGALTGNSTTATTLANARTINGTSFNGSANITVTAAADTLTGTTLAALSGVNLTALNASNLASGTVGTARLGSGTANSTSLLRGDQTWFRTSYLMTMSADVSAPSTTLVYSSDTVTIPAGRYKYYGVITAHTASATAGITALMAASTDCSDDTMTMLQIYTSTTNDTTYSNPTLAVTTMRHDASIASYIVSAYSDAPTKFVMGVAQGQISFAATATLSFAVQQRTTTDGANPSILQKASFIHLEPIW